MQDITAVSGMLMTGMIVWTVMKSKISTVELQHALAARSLEHIKEQQDLAITAATATVQRDALYQFISELHWVPGPQRNIRHEGFWSKRYYVAFETTLYFRQLPITPT